MTELEETRNEDIAAAQHWMAMLEQGAVVKVGGQVAVRMYRRLLEAEADLGDNIEQASTGGPDFTAKD